MFLPRFGNLPPQCGNETFAVIPEVYGSSPGSHPDSLPLGSLTQHFCKP